MTPEDPETWLRAHQPVLEELHRVEQSLRSHAREVGRLVRAQTGDHVVEQALVALTADCEILQRVCNILNHCTPPPGEAAATTFQHAVIKLCEAAHAENLGVLVTEFEAGSASLQAVEAELQVANPT